MLTNEELEVEGLKIAKELSRRLDILEEKVSKCDTLSSDCDCDEDESEEEKVEKSQWAYKDSEGNVRVTEERFEDEDDFYNSYSNDDTEAIQPISGTEEYLPKSEN